MSPSSPPNRTARRRRLPLALSLVAVIGAVAAFEVANSGDGDTIGKRAPALPSEVITPPGMTVAKLRGAPAAINFWASWCTPCRREMPELEQLHRSRQGRWHIVGVNWNDRQSSARAFIRDYNATFPNLRDPDGSIGRSYGIIGLPTTVILDSKGRVAELLAGPQTVGSLRSAFERAG
jgi:cytochrome c biogenesis protein CcmG, thiol:disulfide interchange protein DsbE